MCSVPMVIYHFISLDDILYLKADNNTTDIHLLSGKKFRGLKP